MYIFVVANCFILRNPWFTSACCFLDASKAFDRVLNMKLFEKLIQRKVSRCFVGLLKHWYKAVMCPRRFRRVRVESESQAPRVIVIKNFFESESNHDLVESEPSHKNCRVTSSHWLASSSQCRLKWNFTFFYDFFML